MTSTLTIQSVARKALDVGLRLKQMSDRERIKQTSAELHLKKLDKVDKEITNRLALIFSYQVNTFRIELLKLPAFDGSVESFVDRVYKLHDWDRFIVDEIFPALARGMSETAVAFALLMGVDIRKPRVKPQRSTASEWLEETGVDLPPGIATELPDWMKKEIASTLRDTFKEPYWKKISRTTRDDILQTLKTGVANGESIRKLAQRIALAHGDEYSTQRARTVARTESGNALNAARNLSFKKLKQELGAAGDHINKSWLSILSATTRDAHADLDGVMADADGMWSLNGVRVPWPGHASLPAKDRVNCYCSIQTEFGADAPPSEQIEEALNPAVTEIPVADKPEPVESQDLRDPKAWENWSLFERLEKIPQLQEIQQNFASIGEDDDLSMSVERLNESVRHLYLTKKVYAENIQLAEESFKSGRIDLEDFTDRMESYSKRLMELDADLNDELRYLKQAREALMKDVDLIPKKERVIFSHVMRRDVDGLLRGTVDDAAEFMSMFMDPKIAKEIKFDVRQLGSDGRPYALRSGARPSINLAAHNPMEVAVHEMGHVVEYHLGADAPNAFLTRRIGRAGSPTVSMKRYGPGFADSETGNEDSFQAAWRGNARYAAYNGKRYPGLHGVPESTEIVSMGVELLAKDPVGFAKRDPEYFKFIIAYLRGWL